MLKNPHLQAVLHIFYGNIDPIRNVAVSPTEKYSRRVKKNLVSSFTIVFNRKKTLTFISSPSPSGQFSVIDAHGSLGNIYVGLRAPCRQI